MEKTGFMNANVSRRRFLRGLGVTMALPGLESLLPRTLASVTAPNALATSPTGAPLRMAFMYFPNGAIQDAWWPSTEGKDFSFAKTMEPLEKLKHRIQV